jgi:enterochelin esterase-like enzyme
MRLLDSDKPLPDLYLACGKDDPLCEDNRNFSRYLLSIGFPHVYEEEPGGHDWLFWRTYMERGIARIFEAEHPLVPASNRSGSAFAEGGI